MISTLPKYVSVNLRSIQETRVENFTRDEFETGPIQQRRLSCVPRYQLTATMQICSDHYDDFLCWFEDILCGGTQYFKMKHPVSGKEYRWRFAGNQLAFNFIPQTLYETQVTLERWGK